MNRFKGSVTIGLWINDGRIGNQVNEIRQALIEESQISKDMCLLTPSTHQ